ncbi:shikimate dehydrogenase [Paraclostridium ghonii]|uniref:shikimate dehydrogenase n=1 Tax=Paraclostridium ghonii TaxID=29358 RepID=UPI00202D0B8D|nr:shikimate dehydrogenase [Paeniclostridium ghonii]MCM0165194.1 shikimate dehydrogenase [Paeniclostridium ghonii]
MDINSKTNLLCLLGSPVEHSFSPNIHNYLINKNNLNMKYVCFDVKSDDLGNAVKGIKALGIKGCNVTIPHKVDIMKYLDEVEKNALLIGAVNTIKNDNGKLIGYNTDGIGFVKSIIDKGHDIYNKKILIIGAGGAARSIAVEMASNGVKEIEIRNRSKKNAKEICDIINGNFNVNSKYSTEIITKEDLENIDIIINTTPIGMDKDKDNCPIDESIYLIKKDILLCDIVYNPQETRFISWGKKNNLDIVYGIDMLINQAIQGFYIWTGIYVNENGNLKDILKNV